MSEAKPSVDQCIDFDSILPDSGILFYEECPSDYKIERPILLPLKTSTQTRFEQLQYEAVQVWKEKQKTAKNNAP